MPELELHVNEPSTVGMKWLRRQIPAERIYIGLPPACLPSDVQYDMIYLSTVDYGIPTRELTHLLEELRAQLAPGGELVCLSASRQGIVIIHADEQARQRDQGNEQFFHAATA